MAIVTVAGAVSSVPPRTITSVYNIEINTPADVSVAQGLLLQATNQALSGGLTINPFDQTSSSTSLDPPLGASILEITTPETVSGGGGISPFTLPGGTQFVADGSPFADTINGGGIDNLTLVARGDLTFTNSGFDNTLLVGGGSNDIHLTDSISGAGTDTVFGGNGFDTVSVTADNARVQGGSGFLSFTGGSGSDTVFGGSGAVSAQGGSAGHNFLVTGDLSSTLIGGGSGDLLVATGKGTQTLIAGSGNETLTGGHHLLSPAPASGDLVIHAGSGTDVLGGGLGSDTIFAGSGHAALWGGSKAGGTNYFVFTNGQAGGIDWLANFNQGSDLIDLRGYAANQVANAVANQQQFTYSAGGVTVSGVTLTLGDNTHLSVLGISHLTSSDFTTVNNV